MKTIFTNGCFDILHRGHIELLKYCSSLGYVVVGLNSDYSVVELKGPTRPHFSQEDRKFMLDAVKLNGFTLEFAGNELKKNKKIVYEAVKRNAGSLRYADKSLKKDRDFIFKILKKKS